MADRIARLSVNEAIKVIARRRELNAPPIFHVARGVVVAIPKDYDRAKIKEMLKVLGNLQAYKDPRTSEYFRKTAAAMLAFEDRYGESAWSNAK